MSEFSTRSMHPGKRVSEGSADQLGTVLEQFAGDAAEEAKVQAERRRAGNGKGRTYQGSSEIKKVYSLLRLL
ncbi:MAG: hypothetical protein ABEJ03_01475 [Candidatus Nanohaloarchaea archaeon]